MMFMMPVAAFFVGVGVTAIAIGIAKYLRK